YHLDYWNYFNVSEFPNSPEWDGHKPEDITRLLTLVGEK
ncbi:WDGH domain-containing protein, partial [Bacillus licheniformis]